MIGLPITLRRTTLDLIVMPIDLRIAESFTQDISEVPTEKLCTSRWMRNGYPEPWRGGNINNVQSLFCPHAPELKRTVRQRRSAYNFEGTHSWIDVGLQVLNCVGWRPECAQPQMKNIMRAIPPTVGPETKLFLDRNFGPHEKQIRYKGRMTTARQVEVTASVLKVDEVVATLVIVCVDGRVRFSSGYVHGYSLLEDSPIYAQEACVLHALRVVHEWTSNVDQEQLQ